MSVEDARAYAIQLRGVEVLVLELPVGLLTEERQQALKDRIRKDLRADGMDPPPTVIVVPREG